MGQTIAKVDQDSSDGVEIRRTAKHLDTALAQSVAWTSSVKWVVQLFTWISTLFVARLLTPEDYGLVAMAAIYIGMVALLTEFGLGSAVVVLQDLSDYDVAQINGVAVTFGVLAFIVSCLLALPIGNFFKAPELPLVVVVMSTGFLFTGFRTVPAGLLMKDLQFKRLALLEAAQATVLSVSVLIFALSGLKYWTLVLSRLLGEVISTVLIFSVRPHRLAVPRRTLVSKALTFSWHIVVSRLCWFTYSNADFLVTGRILGQSDLGSYNLGWTLANIPNEKVTALVSRVTPAFFSSVQKENAALRRYLLLITEGLAVCIFPMTVGIALTADDFVHVTLGEKWAAVVEPLRLLALYASFRSIATLLPQVLSVTNETRFAMWNAIIAAVVLPVSFYWASGYGTAGIAAAWIAVHPVITLPLYWKVFKKIELGLNDYFNAIKPALFAVLAMTVSIWALEYVLPLDLPRPVIFTFKILGGCVAYIGLLLILSRQRLVELYRTITAKSF